VGRAAARAIAPEPGGADSRRRRHRTGFDAELDELRAIDDHCGTFLIDLETRERERTGIANLKVEYNRVHGFYIEVTNAHVEKIPDDYPAPADAEECRALHHARVEGVRGPALSAQERALAREKAALRRASRTLRQRSRCCSAPARRSRRSTC
jgi:DNA mismatch repair protein MutS